MVAKWCAILVSVLLVNSGMAASPRELDTTQDAHELYESARRALGSGDYTLAVDLLTRLQRVAEAEPNAVGATLRWLCNFHLAELYAHSGELELSLQALLNASSQEVHPQLVLAPERTEHWMRTAEQVASRMLNGPSSSARSVDANGTTISLQKYLQLNREQDQRLTEDAIWREHLERISTLLAVHYETLGQYCLAAEQYRSLLQEFHSISGATDPAATLERLQEWQRGYLRNVMRLAQQAQTREEATKALDSLKVLSSQAWLDIDQRLSIELAATECRMSAGRSSQALQALEDLLSKERDRSSHRSSNNICNLEFKRAEVLERIGRRQEARQTLDDVIANSSAYPKLSELHYLAGRLAVSDADFSVARSHFQAAMQCSSADVDCLGRAAWMIGETHFLQRQYQKALQSYADIQRVAPGSPWYWRGLLQSGKCLELLEEPAAAGRSYATFLEGVTNQDHNFDDELEFARQRSAELERFVKL